MESVDQNSNDEIGIDPKAEIREQRRSRKRKLKTPEQQKALKKEETNQKRRANHIHVQGSDIPAPAEM